MFLRNSIRTISNLLYSELNNNLVKYPLSFAIGRKLCTSTETSLDYRKQTYESYKLKHEHVVEMLEKFDTRPSNSEWSQFKSSVLSYKSAVNEQNIDAIVLGYCLTECKLDLAKSYIGFLQTNNIEPNIATIGKLLRTYHSHFQQKSVPVEENDAILKWCNKLMARGILDAITSENVIHGLVLTDQWEKSLSIFNTIKITATPSASAYSVITEAAFKNDKPEIGWEFLEKTILSDRLPKCSVYLAWIDYCLKCYKTSKDEKQLLSMLEKMLNFISTNDIYITKLVGQKFMDVFKTIKWTGGFTNIINGCKCKSCKGTLQPIKISVDEFSKLQKEFLSRVLVRKDVFVRSTPTELSSFRETLETSAPFDIVIDGLNVAFSTGKRNPRDLANIVGAVVKYFADRGKKILVFGRKHMNKWPQKNLQYIKRNAHVFLAENLSFDDPYLLYAAIYSGRDTCFVSRDLMRGHRFLLKDNEIKETFRKWQIGHQYQLESIKPNGDVIFKLPLEYLPSAQQTKNSWHIPYIQEYTNNTNLNKLEAPTDWICLQSKNK